MHRPIFHILSVVRSKICVIDGKKNPRAKTKLKTNLDWLATCQSLLLYVCVAIYNCLKINYAACYAGIAEDIFKQLPKSLWQNVGSGCVDWLQCLKSYRMKGWWATKRFLSIVSYHIQQHILMCGSEIYIVRVYNFETRLERTKMNWSVIVIWWRRRI